MTAVIGSAVVPTLIAQRWFLPELRLIEGVAARAVAEAEPVAAPVREG